MSLNSIFSAFPKISLLPRRDYIGALIGFSIASIVSKVALKYLDSEAYNVENIKKYSYTIYSSRQKASLVTPEAYKRLMNCCKIQAVQMAGVFIPTLYIIGKGLRVLDELSSYANAAIALTAFIGAVSLSKNLVDSLIKFLPEGYYDANPLRLLGGFDKRDPIVVNSSQISKLNSSIKNLEKMLKDRYLLIDPMHTLEGKVLGIRANFAFLGDEGYVQVDRDIKGMEELLNDPKAVHMIPLHLYGELGPSLNELTQGYQGGYTNYFQSWKKQSVCMVKYALQYHANGITKDDILAQTGEGVNRALLSENELRKLANNLLIVRDHVEGLEIDIEVAPNMEGDKAASVRDIKDAIYASLQADLTRFAD